jgi:hypothetical protein
MLIRDFEFVLGQTLISCVHCGWLSEGRRLPVANSCPRRADARLRDVNAPARESLGLAWKKP